MQNPEVQRDLIEILDGNIGPVLTQRLGIPARDRAVVIDAVEAKRITVEDILADPKVVDSITAVAVWALKQQRDDAVIAAIETKLDPSRLLDPKVELNPMVHAAKILADCPHPSVGPMIAKLINACLGDFDNSAPQLALLRDVLELFGPEQGRERPAGAELADALARARLHGLLDDEIHDRANAALAAREISSPDQFEYRATLAAHRALVRAIEGAF